MRRENVITVAQTHSRIRLSRHTELVDRPPLNPRHQGCIPLGLLAMVLGVATGAAAEPVERGFEIVRQGISVAAIIKADIAENPKVIDDAANELRYHLELATGAKLPVLREQEWKDTPNHDVPSIHVGPTSAAKSAGIDVSALRPNGFVMRTVGNQLFLLGKDGGEDTPLHDRVSMGTLFAVYEFLERQMGVRWLWPGELGEFIPRQETISSGTWDHTDDARLMQRQWQFDTLPSAGKQGWSTEAAWYKHKVDTYRWLRRQRISRSYTLDYGEAFTGYWQRFQTSHPEYFNLLPNGQREPDPQHPGHVSMCQSEPGLWKQMVDDWKLHRTPMLPWVNCCPNDTPNKCVCENDLAWDGRTADEQTQVLTRVREAFEQHPVTPRDWWQELGPLSNRYARYLLAVQNEARRVDPEATVIGYAYENYMRPPQQVQLNDRVVVMLANYLSFPYDEEISREFRSDCEGWSAAGARLILRPNITYGWHNLPAHYADRAGADIQFAFSHGVIATDLDSLTGQWAAQGPSLYVIARVQLYPQQPVAEMLADYYRGFGPAADDVRAYFDHWKTNLTGLSRDQWNAFAIDRDHQDPGVLNFRTFYTVAEKFYSTQAFDEGHAILDRAALAAQGDDLASRRVAFLHAGLRDAELTLAVQRAFDFSRRGGDRASFIAARESLFRFRAENEAILYANIAYSTFCENQSWSR